MKIQRFVFVFLFITSLFLSLNGFSQQTYKTAIGLRGGYPSGITAKHFIKGSSALEGVLSFGGWGFGFTGLYQIHVPITEAPGFNWYYGGGTHIGFAKAANSNPFLKDKEQKLFLGVDGVFGAEYVFPDVPISISLDITPMVSLLPEIYPWFNAGISVRYVLK
jgi:hypothetical protein